MWFCYSYEFRLIYIMKLNFYSEKKYWYEIKIFIKHCFSETRLYQSELVTKNSWVTKGNRGEWSEHKGSLGRRNSPMWVGAHKQIHFKSCKVFQDTFLLFFCFIPRTWSSLSFSRIYLSYQSINSIFCFSIGLSWIIWWYGGYALRSWKEDENPLKLFNFASWRSNLLELPHKLLEF